MKPVLRSFNLIASLMLCSGMFLSLNANAGSRGPCVNLRSFAMEFRTGGDDLRGNSEVIVWLMTRNGDVELQHVWGGFGNNSSNYRLVPLQNPNWNVNSCDVTGVKIRMVSHPSWPEGDDNWNMDGFTIHGYGEDGSYSYFFSANGAPLKRFTGSSQWWERYE